MPIKGLIYTGIVGPQGQPLATIVMTNMDLYRKTPAYRMMAKRGIKHEVEVDAEDQDKDYIVLTTMDKYKPPLDN